MKPMDIRGTGYIEKDNRSYYIIVKDNSIVKPINEIMEKIGSDPYFYNENDGPETCINDLRHIKNNNYDIDFVFTENRLIIIVRADKKHQNNFKELILAYGLFKD